MNTLKLNDNEKTLQTTLKKLFGDQPSNHIDVNITFTRDDPRTYLQQGVGDQSATNKKKKEFI